jgi:hypothetical protein
MTSTAVVAICHSFSSARRFVEGLLQGFGGVWEAQLAGPGGRRWQRGSGWITTAEAFGTRNALGHADCLLLSEGVFNRLFEEGGT